MEKSLYKSEYMYATYLTTSKTL